MRSHADAPQAIGNPKYGASFVLLSGLEGDGYEPYQKSHSRYSVEAHDRDIVDLLRTWASSHPIDTCMYVTYSCSPEIFCTLRRRCSADELM